MPRSQAIIDLIANDKRFKAAMSRVRRTMKRVRESMQAVAQTARRMLVIGTAAIAGLLRLSSNQIKAETKLEAVLRATRYAAGLNAEALKKEASELQRLTGIGDETIISMQALLATFKQIKGDEFSRATKAILDMSIVMDQDLRSGAIQVGKALNDPIKGITALSRVGIQFTNQQREMINALVEGGEISKAQAVILDELESQFGNVAEAVGKKFPGAAKKAVSAVGDLGEQIGNVFVPAATAIANKITEVSQRISEWVKANQTLVKVGTGIAATITTLLALIPTLAGAIVILAKSLVVLRAALIKVTGAMAATGAAVAAAAVSIGILIGRIAAMRMELASLKRSTQTATTSLNEAAEASKRLKEALKVKDFSAAFIAAKDRAAALEAALKNIEDQAAKVREEMESTSYVFNQEQQQIRLNALLRQAAALQKQLTAAKAEEAKLGVQAVKQAQVEAKRAKEVAELEERREEHLKKNASLLEQIRQINDEIAVLNGTITKEQAEVNTLIAQGYDLLVAMRLVSEKARRDKKLAAKEDAKTLEDEAKAIRKSLKTDKERLAAEIARVNEIRQAGRLTREESAAKIAALQQEFKERQRANQLTGTIQSAEALFRRTQEAAGARTRNDQQTLTQVGNQIENAVAAGTRKTEEVALAVDLFRATFDKTIDETALIGRFGN